ncbi:PAS domain S-box protein [Halorientalis salina]|uniref:PAS domain S-box protein n=1 Tax=Halorientalis salina TaxID=2932266 RepID=UPI0010AD08E2|nr:PAS domain S-box protein [Halorientalis salina]
MSRESGDSKSGRSTDRGRGDGHTGEQWCSGLAAAVPESVYRLDGDRHLTAVDDALVELTGYARDELVGEHVSVLFDGEAFARSELAIQRLSGDSDGDVEPVAVTVATADGDAVPCTLRVGEGDGGRGTTVGVLTPADDHDGAVPTEPAPAVDTAGNEGRQWKHSRQFEGMIDAVEDYAIFMLDPDGRIVTWNEGARRLKGYEEAEIVGDHVSTFYTEGDRERGVPDRNLSDAAAEGRVEDEGWRVRKDGSRFWANVVITAVRDDDGRLQGFTKVTRDMTERREYEQRLATERDALESELTEVFERITDAFFALDDEWRFTYVNELAAQFLDTERSALIGADIWAAFPSAVDTTFQAEYERAMAHQEPVSFEEYLPTVEAWFAVEAHPSESGLSVYFRDVTARKQREQELERYRQYTDDILGAVDDVFYVLDADGTLQRWNEQLSAVTGRPDAEIDGMHVLDFFTESDRSAIAEAIEEAFETGYVRVEAPFLTKDGERVPHEFVASRLEDPDGNPVLAGVGRDISERRARERELERYETIVETVSDGIYVIDNDGRLTLVNDAYTELVGLPADELVGSHVSRLVERGTVDGDVIARAQEVEAEMRAGGRDAASLDATLHRPDGTAIETEATFSLVETDDGTDRVGVVRDISERKEREQELQTRVRQQRVVTRLGQQALAEDDLDALFEEAADLVSGILGNDYCKVLELLPDGEEMALRSGVGWRDGLVGSAHVPTDRHSQAGHTLVSEEPVVVPDMDAETRFTGPELLTSHDVQSGVSVVIGAPEDPWGVLSTHDTETREYTRQDVDFVQSVANILATAIDRTEHEHQIERQRERLAALNNLNGVIRDIVSVLIDQSTREDVEQLVCERLADADSYEFAWIGAVEGDTDEVALRTEAGVEGYLDDVTITVDDSEHSQGPTGRALRTGEVQICQDVLTDPAYEQWQDRAREYGYRSSAAIPITYENTTYGVLNVYADRPAAFGGEERAVVEQLGRVVGHVINAIERKRLLMSDEVVEVEFRIRDVFEKLDIEEAGAGEIEIEQTIPISEGYLAYGTVTDDGVETLERLVEQLPDWEDVSFIGDGFERQRYELHLSEPPALHIVTAHGGHIPSATFADGDYRMTAELPPDAPVRAVVDEVREAYPGAVVLAQRRTTAGRDGDADSRDHVDLGELLTERQFAALQAAYFAGFFEWPRESTGEDVADALGISPPTFHQHLRGAEQRILAAIVEGESTT